MANNYLYNERERELKRRAREVVRKEAELQMIEEDMYDTFEKVGILVFASGFILGQLVGFLKSL